ncbi:hypothetical protein LOTGIDRAFT_156198 [Lottia gigantea]|uniref:Uncharacterized protein n=1 Tax=Lottia gigantea TaxID=225164 RepID=V4B3L2_LOTGI|nr:hypothetical protein LOTGIDRAFT_156198 [Lottia gigantea]ESP04953.1 hypothetical protein LOTGIDRAFT_156198 [Lottia gigantea]
MAEKTVDQSKAAPSKSQTNNQSASDSGIQEDGESKVSSDGQKIPGDAIPKKRSTFKITSVTTTHTTPNSRGGSGDLTADVDGDSIDDLDESHTEDFSSDIYDVSRATDLDQDVLLTPEEVIAKEKPSDNQSRFKVVKIETKEPFRRGRWYCHDFLDPENKTEKQSEEITVHSGNSSAGNSVHYVHGVDDPSKNPLLAGGTGTVNTSSGGSNEGSIPGQTETFVPIHPAPHASQPVPQVSHMQSQRQSTPGLPGNDTSNPSPVPSNLPSGHPVSGVTSVQSGVGQNPPGHQNSSQNLPNINAQSVPHMPQSMTKAGEGQNVAGQTAGHGQTGANPGQSAMQGSHYTDPKSFNSQQPYSMTNVPMPGQAPQSLVKPLNQAGGAPNVDSGAPQSQSAMTSNVPVTTKQPAGQSTNLSAPKSQSSVPGTISSGNLSGMQGQDKPNESRGIASSTPRRASMVEGMRMTEELQNLVNDHPGIPELLSAVSGRESPAKELKEESERRSLVQMGH